MKQRVSRRNGRTSTSGTIPISHVALCGISLVVLVCGAGSLSWALQKHESLQSQPVVAESRQAVSQPDPYEGVISAGIDEGGADAASSDDDPGPEGAQQDARGVSTQGPAPEQMVDEPIDPSPVEPTGAGSASSTAAQEEAPSTQRHRVIHHTAAREEVAYRTVHHQASTPREVTVGGVTRIEWTSCPVCGQRHDSAYNERLVDHVNRIGCTACGGFHDSSYDETVWD